MLLVPNLHLPRENPMYDSALPGDVRLLVKVYIETAVIIELDSKHLY